MIAALNKYWRPLTVKEYLHEMDIPMVSDAVAVSGLPKEVIDWIWEEKKRFRVETTMTQRRT